MRLCECYYSRGFLNRKLGGAWRSPEARLNGVQEVAGSNPVAPTFETNGDQPDLHLAIEICGEQVF